MSDRRLDQLFLRFQERGDVTALAGVFDLAAPELLRVARHLARDEALAEDALQSTFLVAIERRAEHEAGRRVMPWLLGILIRQVRRGRALAARRPDAGRIERQAPEDPAQVTAEREVAELVERHVERLPPTYAGALRAHLLREAGPREVAQELGISANAASVRIHRGLELLRRSLPRGAAIGTAAAVAEAARLGSSPSATHSLAAVRDRVLAHADRALTTALSTTVLAVPAGASVLGALSASKLTLASLASAAVLAAALGHSTHARSRDQTRLEAEISLLEARLARVAVVETGRSTPPASEALAAPSARVAAAPAASGDTAQPEAAAKEQTLDAAGWLARFEAASDFREAWGLASKLAATGEAASLEILREIFHDIPVAVHRVQVLKPFVFDGGLGNAVEVLHLAATDPEVELRSAAWRFLSNYAFRDFSEDPSTYAAWRERFAGVAIPELLRATTADFVERLSSSSEQEFVRLLEALRTLEVRTGGKQGVDVVAMLNAAGLTQHLERRIHEADSEEAVTQALRWLAQAKPEEGVLRRTALPILGDSSSHPPGVVHAAVSALGRGGQTWAAAEIVDALLSNPPGSAVYRGAGSALAEIGDERVIPTVIGIIAAEDIYETRYGLGYFALYPLTGVKYDEGHDAAFWVSWWEKNRGQYPPEVAGLPIPNVSLPQATDR